MLDLLETFVQKRGYSYVRMDGATAIASRQPLVACFNTVSFFVTVSVVHAHDAFTLYVCYQKNVCRLNDLCDFFLAELLIFYTVSQKKHPGHF